MPTLRYHLGFCTGHAPCFYQADVFRGAFPLRYSSLGACPWSSRWAHRAVVVRLMLAVRPVALFSTSPWVSDHRSINLQQGDISPHEHQDGSVTRTALLRARPPFDEVLSNASNETIWSALRVLRQGEGALEKSAAFISFLINKRGIKPNIAMYETLLHLQADRFGSADAISDLMDGMENHGITPSSYACHSILRALTIHPDYLIRENTLCIMKTHGYELRLSGHIDVLLGLLRDEQYEMAIEKLEQHFNEGDCIPKYIYDIFIYRFADLGYVQDALRILRHRIGALGSEDSHPSTALWCHLLECSADRMDHKSTKYIWEQCVYRTADIVEPHPFFVSDGLAEKVQETAARYGDVKLALQAMGLLVHRGVKLLRHHYEALIECYVAAGQIEDAIHTVTVMENNLEHSTRASTRSIFQVFLQYPTALQNVIDLLAPVAPADLHSPALEARSPQGLEASPQVFAVVLEAVLHVHGCDGPQGAMALLERFLATAAARLDADSYNVFLRGSPSATTVAQVERLLRQSRVKINSETMNHLLRFHAEHTVDYVAARKWAMLINSQAAKAYRLVPSEDAANSFIKRALKERDYRVIKFLNVCTNLRLWIDPNLRTKVAELRRTFIGDPPENDATGSGYEDVEAQW